jgi:RecJ-like exonuclease
MAQFKATIKLADGDDFDLPAETCPSCKGIGYLTASFTYESRRADEDSFHIHKAESGDCCPTCLGRGWVGVLGRSQSP